MTHAAKIVQKPHVLFTGSNGKITAGIEIALLPNDSCFGVHGFRQQYSVNRRTLEMYQQQYKRFLNLTDDDFTSIMEILSELEDG